MEQPSRPKETEQEEEGEKREENEERKKDLVVRVPDRINFDRRSIRYNLSRH